MTYNKFEFKYVELASIYDELLKTADQRLEMLKEWDEYRKARERPCPFCFEVAHTGYCELAAVLKD